MPEESVGESKPRQSSGRCRIIFVVFLVLITAAALTVGLVLNKYLNKDDNNNIPPTVPKVSVDCHPDNQRTDDSRWLHLMPGDLKNPDEPSITQETCEDRGCTWLGNTNNDRRPKCVFPEDYGYTAENKEVMEPNNGMEYKLMRSDTPKLYGMDPYPNVAVKVEYQTDKRLRIKFYPTNTSVFEIPNDAVDIPSGNGSSEMTRLYDVTFAHGPVFGVKVKRRSSNVTIFDTSLPGMAMYPQFLQISTRLNNSYIYGFGEHRHETFRHDMNYRTWSIFTRDAGPDNNWNLYGAHPVYMNVETDGAANMVFLKNSNAMEVMMHPDPNPALTFRVIGGVLDFYIFLGDSPGDAVSLYTEAVGRPVLPPYWALGYQLSRWGYANISDMRMVVDRNRAAGIPYDVQWADIDSLYEEYVFTYDRTEWGGLPQLVQDLHDHNQRFIVIVDPGVGANETKIAEAKGNSPGYNMYHDGETDGVFVRAQNGSTLIATVWPGLTAYPDYSNVSIENWYEKYVRFYRENESIGVDALWIDMNEPSSFVPGSVSGCEHTTWDYPPYVPRILGAGWDGKMYDKTICMTAQMAWGPQYDTHSLYAHAMAIRTSSVLKKVFPGKRPWTMTRSSFAGTGHYATKWMGDNQARWPAMHWSIIGIMEFSVFGFAMNGADICGFWYETTYEMCVRWHQLGAFYPFARNHNGRGDLPEIFKHQDPGAFDQRFIDIVKKPLMTRYRLLPYIYTQLFKAHLHGHTVLTSLMFEFPTDMTAREVDRQFLLGPSLLVSPVLEANAVSVKAYFPPASRWYRYASGQEEHPNAEDKGHVTLNTPLEDFNLHIRGGHVIPWQTPALTTVDSRQKDMGLIVALDSFGTAQGELYWDDGETEVSSSSYSIVSFKMEKAGELILTPTKADYSPSPALHFVEVDIYGLSRLPAQVAVDGTPLSNANVRWDNQIVQLFGFNLTILTNHNITWSVY